MFNLNIPTTITSTENTPTWTIQDTVQLLDTLDIAIQEASSYELLMHQHMSSTEGMLTDVKDAFVKFCKWFVDTIKKIIQAIVNFFTRSKTTTSNSGLLKQDWTNVGLKMQKNQNTNTKDKNTPLPYDISKWQNAMLALDRTSGMTVLDDNYTFFDDYLSAISITIKKQHDYINRLLQKTTPKQYSLDDIHYAGTVLSSYLLLSRTSIDNCRVILDKYTTKITPDTMTVDLLHSMAVEVRRCVSSKGTGLPAATKSNNTDPKTITKVARYLLILIKRLLTCRTAETTTIMPILKALFTRYDAAASMIHEEIQIPADLVKRMGEYYGFTSFKLDNVIITDVIDWGRTYKKGGSKVGGLTVPGGTNTPTTVYITTAMLHSKLLRYDVTNQFNAYDNTEEISMKECTKELVIIHTLLHEGCHAADAQQGKNIRYTKGGDYKAYDFEKAARLASRKFKILPADITWAKKVIAIYNRLK